MEGKEGGKEKGRKEKKIEEFRRWQKSTAKIVAPLVVLSNPK